MAPTNPDLLSNRERGPVELCSVWSKARASCTSSAATNLNQQFARGLAQPHTLTAIIVPTLAPTWFLLRTAIMVALKILPRVFLFHTVLGRCWSSRNQEEQTHYQTLGRWKRAELKNWPERKIQSRKRLFAMAHDRYRDVDQGNWQFCVWCRIDWKVKIKKYASQVLSRESSRRKGWRY